MIKTFSQLKIGNVFEFAGALYIKHSTRTAYLARYKQRFYFGKNDACKLMLDDRYMIKRDETRFMRSYKVFFCGVLQFCSNGSLEDVVYKASCYEDQRSRNCA